MDATEPATQDYTPARRVTAYASMIAVPLCCGYVAIQIVVSAWPLTFDRFWYQGPLMLIVALLMWLALGVSVSALRTKRKTGRFLPSPAEAARRANESWKKLGAGKPLRAQLWLWLLPSLLSAFLLWLGGIAVSLAFTCECAPPDRSGIAILSAAALITCGGLAYPFIAARRKLRTGSFLPSEEELAKRRARRAKPAPLWQRIFTAACWWSLAITWTLSAVHRHHSNSPIPPELQAGLAAFIAVIWTLQLFNPRTPARALSLTAEDAADGSNAGTNRTEADTSKIKR